jgi:hypothetical protein
MKEKRNKIIAIIIIFSLTISIGFIFNNPPIEKKTIPASFIYSNKTGFEGNKTALTFGALTKNQAAERSIKIDNNYNFPVRIKIESAGEIEDYIIVSENDFTIKPNESKDIKFSVVTNSNLKEYRRYPGEVIIKSYKT